MPTAAAHKPDDEAPAGDSETLAFPAAMSQEAFYYLERLQPETSPFNIAVRFRIDGPIDPRVIEKALQAIIARHESLRTQFEEDGGELLQIVVPAAAFPLRTIDISAQTPAEQEAAAARLGKEEAVRPFVMEQAPLMRAELIRLAPEEHILHITLHHAVSDGWSIGVLIDELAAHYQAILQNVPPSLPPLPIQYPDFAVWQREFLEGPEIARQLAFWKEQLRGHVEPEFPTDRPRPAVKRWNGDIVSELLPVELTDRLRTIAVQNGATLFHVFLTAFKVLLNRYTGSEDIAIGTPIAGRTRAELEPLIGTFINTVILRSDLSGDPDFPTLLQRIRDTALQALSNQDLPFESLVRALRPRRDAGRNPLFQINFTHQRDFVKPVELGQARLTAIPSLPSGAIFDLHFFMVERGDVWRASCDFNTDLFEKATALRFLGHFRTLLESIAAAPQGKVREFPLLPPEESALLLSWSGRTSAYPRESSIGRRFEEIAARHAGRKALACGGSSMTYAELLARSRKLAAALQAHGARPGKSVVLVADSSPEAITAILAIVLSGAAYVPIDPECPPERLAALLRDTAPQVVLAAPESADRIPPDIQPVWTLGHCPETAAPAGMTPEPAA
ncbi:MAG TPA: condensation domain-containing protein, partial [Terrimicrobiaceae bacterium]|nr:condensation domain-containing protein [Terrimicrobiaceae bacterium]